MLEASLLVSGSFAPFLWYMGTQINICLWVLVWIFFHVVVSCESPRDYRVLREYTRVGANETSLGEMAMSWACQSPCFCKCKVSIQHRFANASHSSQDPVQVLSLQTNYCIKVWGKFYFSIIWFYDSSILSIWMKLLFLNNVGN